MRVFLVLFSIVLIGCSGSKQSISASDKDSFEAIVNQKEFQFNGEWALPFGTNSLNSVISNLAFRNGTTVGSINLYDKNAYLKINDSIVEASLPYYGERQIGGVFNSQDISLRFEGKPNNFNIVKNDKKERFKITFGIASSNSTEIYQVTMFLFYNKNCSVSINSTHRTPIRYRGKIVAFEEGVTLR